MKKMKAKTAAWFK